MQHRDTGNDSQVRSVIAANLQTLRQGLELLRQIDDRLYVATLPHFSYGIGSHFRHCLDSFQCFLQHLASGQIDYDRRSRDELTAVDRACAMARIAETMELLERSVTHDQPLQARLDSPHYADSSALRELQFLLSHTIHHYALVALALRLQGFAPDAEFGVAPSTLEYWKEEARCVR